MSCSSCSRMWQCHTYSWPPVRGLKGSPMDAGSLGRLNCMISVITSLGFIGTVSFQPISLASGGYGLADGRERQVSGHQRLAVRCQLPQETHPDAGRLLGVVFEAVVPVGVFKPDREHGVAGERQPVAAGRQADHAVPGGCGRRCV